MKTLEQLKNDYAVSKGFKDWNTLFINTSHAPRDLEKHMDNICLITQKECLKLASENAEADHHPIHIEWVPVVNKQSITNENNLIK